MLGVRSSSVKNCHYFVQKAFIIAFSDNGGLVSLGVQTFRVFRGNWEREERMILTLLLGLFPREDRRSQRGIREIWTSLLVEKIFYLH